MQVRSQCAFAILIWTLGLTIGALATTSVHSIDVEVPILDNLQLSSMYDLVTAWNVTAINEYISVNELNVNVSTTLWNAAHPKTACAWYGIQCDTHGFVIAIELSNVNVNGILPESMGWLIQLQVLSVHHANLRGTLPLSLSDFINLQTLELNHNALEGVIPNVFKELTQLIVIDLSNNNFIGGVPTTIRACKKLARLSVHDNALSGTVPTVVSAIPHLQLEIENNDKLAIASASWQMQQDAILDMLNVWDVTSLNTYITVYDYYYTTWDIDNSDSMCMWYGIICDNSQSNIVGLNFDPTVGLSVTPETELLTPAAAIVDLNGPIPPSIVNLTALIQLTLYDVGLTGSIPSIIGQMTQLGILQLDSNMLTGTIPDVFANMFRLQTFTVSGNLLTGTLPPSLGAAINVQYLVAYSNMLTGGIPESYGNFFMLDALLVHDNLLNGTVPASLNQLTLLQVACFGEYIECDVTTYIEKKNAKLLSVPKVLRSTQTTVHTIQRQSVEYYYGDNCLYWPCSNPFIGNAGLSCQTDQTNCIDPQCAGTAYEQPCNISSTVQWYLMNVLPTTQLFVTEAQLTAQTIIFNLTDIVQSNGPSCNITFSITANGALMTSATELLVTESGTIMIAAACPIESRVAPLSPAISLTVTVTSDPTQIAFIDLLEAWNVDTINSDAQCKVPWTQIDIENICTWCFVSCVDGYVKELQLDSIALDGVIPASIGTLVNVSTLQLSNAYVLGTIPDALAQLTHLTHLDLSNNALTDAIPDVFASINSLHYLNLSANSLMGNVPASLSACVNLSVVDVSQNSLSPGFELAVFGDALTIINTAIQTLTPSYTRKFNAIKAKVANSLVSENAAIYGLTCLYWPCIPPFSNMSLHTCDISTNNCISPQCAAHYEEFDMCDLPANVSDYVVLPSVDPIAILVTSIQLESAQYSFAINATSACELTYAVLSGPGVIINTTSTLQMHFTGTGTVYVNASCVDVNAYTAPATLILDVTVYSEPSELALVAAIDAWGPTAIAQINTNCGPVSKMQWSIENIPNRCNWCYVACYENSTTLSTLEIVGIPLAGTLPATLLTNLTSIQSLIISNANLTGTISDVFGATWTQLHVFDLSGNVLTGTLPASLSTVPALTEFNVANNQLEGPVISFASSLTELYLANNALSGTIPTALMPTANALQIFDISNNQLNGSVYFASSIAQNLSIASINLEQQSGYGLVWTQCAYPFEFSHVATCNVTTTQINCNAGCNTTYLEQASGCVFDASMCVPLTPVSSITSTTTAVAATADNAAFDTDELSENIANFLAVTVTTTPTAGNNDPNEANNDTVTSTPSTSEAELIQAYSAAWYQTVPVVVQSEFILANTSVNSLIITCAFTITTYEDTTILQSAQLSTSYALNGSVIQTSSCTTTMYANYLTTFMNATIEVSACDAMSLDTCASLENTTESFNFTSNTTTFTSTTSSLLASMPVQIQLYNQAGVPITNIASAPSSNKWARPSARCFAALYSEHDTEIEAIPSAINLPTATLLLTNNETACDAIPVEDGVGNYTVSATVPISDVGVAAFNNLIDGFYIVQTNNMATIPCNQGYSSVIEVSANSSVTANVYACTESDCATVPCT